MERNLIISGPNEVLQLRCISEIRKHLASNYSLENPDSAIKNDVEHHLEALASGKIDLYIQDMAMLPTALPDNMVMATVCERENAQDALVIRASSVDENQPLQLNSEGNIITTSVLQEAFFKEMLPQLEVKTKLGFSLNNFITTDDDDAIVIPYYQALTIVDNNEFKVMPLHYREFTPLAGQGIITLLIGSENMELRHQLQKLGDRETAYTSIVERSIKKAMQAHVEGPIAAYVQKDGKGFYHAYAAVMDEQHSVHRVTISQSTTSGLAESICNELLNKIR